MPKLVAGADAVAHWVLGESLTDLVGGRVLTAVGTTIVPGVWNTNARRFNGTSDRLNLLGVDAALEAALLGAAPFTIEILFTLDPAFAAEGVLFLYGTNSESTSTNDLARIAITSGGAMTERHEHSGGTDALTTSPTALFHDGESYYGGITRSGGITRMWANAALIEEGSGNTNSTLVQPGVNFQISIGSNAAPGEWFRGDIEEIVIRNVAKDSAYFRGVFGFIDQIAPVISNMVPSAGSSIVRTASIQFDVTDNLGGLRRVPIYVKYPSIGLWEVIYDGVNFSPGFSAGSSRTAIANGYRFVVARTGGWLASPTLSTTPYDTFGNEG